MKNKNHGKDTKKMTEQLVYVDGFGNICSEENFVFSKCCKPRPKSWFDNLDTKLVRHSAPSFPEHFRGVIHKMPRHCEDDEDNHNKDFFVFFEDPVPPFLPKEYYTMDVATLFKNSGGGKYWALVSTLFLCHHPNNGFKEWNSLKKPHPSLSNLGLLEESDPMELLLEPWLLVQLPLQPTLLHQWLVAFLIEYLKFEKRQADKFHHYPCPNPWSPHLHLAKTKVDSTRIKFASTFQSARKFLRSAYVSENFGALKWALWKTLVGAAVPLAKVSLQLEQLVANADENVSPCECCNSVDFSMKADSSTDVLDQALPILGIGSIVEFSKHFKDCEGALQTNFNKKSDWEKLADFVQENIFQSGKILGVEWNQTREVLENNLLLAKEFLSYKYFHDILLARTKNEMETSKEGLVQKSLALLCEARMFKNLNEMTALLYSHLIKKFPALPETCKIGGFCSKLLETPGQAKPEENSKEYLSQLEKECDSQQLINKWPALKYEDGQKALVQLITARIKTLVLKMAKRMFFEKGADKVCPYFYPEWPFIQYVLPCFGASFLELEADKTVDVEKKKWFLHFIHRLLCSYQKNPRYPSDKYIPHLVKQEGLIFMLHKAEQIKSILSRAIFGTNKEENIITRDFFSKFLLPLTQFCSRNDIPTTRKSLCFFFYRIEAVLRRCLGAEFFLEPNLNPVKSATALCRMVAASSFRSQGYKECAENVKDLPSLLRVAFENHVKAHRDSLQNMKSKMSKLLIELEAEAKCLTEKQLLQLILHLCLNTPHLRNKPKFKNSRFTEEQDLAFDPTEKAFWNFLDGDLWKLMQYFSVLLEEIKSEVPEELGGVSLQFAKNSAWTCYSPLLAEIKDKKVEMAFPGEITFFPIRHCRWCGLLEAEEEFKVCKWCAEFSDYPDISIFCSAKCEEEALKGEHTEEHARFLNIRCGLSN